MAVQMMSNYQRTICNVWKLMADLKTARLSEGLSNY